MSELVAALQIMGPEEALLEEGKVLIERRTRVSIVLITQIRADVVVAVRFHSISIRCTERGSRGIESSLSRVGVAHPEVAITLR